MRMQALVCEMCGGNDIVKQDGYYVCQHCGTRYTPEEARKMMIEGTVKIDNSAFVEKYLANARRAMQKEDWEEVEKYYNLVEQNDPSNIEAIFYSSYGKARLSMVDSDIYIRQQICDVFCKSISVIDDNYNIEKSEENQKIILQMHFDLFNMYGTSFVYTQKTDGYGNKTDNRYETYYLFAKMAFAFIDSLQNIINVDDQLIYWKMIYEQYKYCVSNTGLTVEARNKNRELALKIGNQIHEKDPSFTVDNIEEAKKKRRLLRGHGGIRLLRLSPGVDAAAVQRRHVSRDLVRPGVHSYLLCREPYHGKVVRQDSLVPEPMEAYPGSNGGAAEPRRRRRHALSGQGLVKAPSGAARQLPHAFAQGSHFIAKASPVRQEPDGGGAEHARRKGCRFP